jgi:hypothetical protein
MFELRIKEEAQWPIRDAHPVFQMEGSRGKGEFCGGLGSLACTVRRLCADMSLVNGQVSENLANPSLPLLAGQASKYKDKSSSSQSTPIQRKGPPPPISLSRINNV